MPQLFHPEIPDPSSTIEVAGDDCHHLIRVRRNTVGDTVYLRTPDGGRVLTEISAIHKNTCILKVTRIIPPVEGPYTLALAMPVLKGRRNDLIVEKGVETGVTRFIPVSFDRSVPDSDSVQKKAQRWRRIVSEAFKQSDAIFMPTIDSPCTSYELFESASGYTNRIIGDVHEQTLFSAAGIGRSVIVAVGPEGGFSDDERKRALNSQWSHVRLHTNQLRAETASIVLPAIVRHFMAL
ncbi:MAG: RsmE family RNA methyltransferase [Spirochaetota bacterium]